ncbi:MAG: DUF362 domain-containing protein [Candidatus Thorarchaeota archaeon]
MTPVAVVRFSGGIRRTLQRGLQLLGGFKELRSPVLIKPNICTIAPSTRYTVSDIEVTKEVVNLLLENDENLSIRIIETDSESKFADEAFEKFGYAAYVEEMLDRGYDLATVNLSKSPTLKIPFDGQYLRNPEIPIELAEPSYYISISIPKTHYLTHITGALKNQFGLLQQKKKSAYHSRIADILIDLNKLAGPNLCIVDARAGLEGWNGPTEHEIGAFLIGREPASVDAATARLMGFDPESIHHIVTAARNGLGNMNPEIVGEDLDAFKVQFKPPKH